MLAYQRVVCNIGICYHHWMGGEFQPPNDLWHWRFPFLSRSEIPMNKAVQFQSFPDLIHDSHSHHSHHHKKILISPIYWTIPHEILTSQNRFPARSWKAACVGSWRRRCCLCAWTWCRGRMDSGLWRIGISWLPSGKHTKSYWSHGPVEIVDLAINSMVMFHSYVAVYQRVYGGFSSMGISEMMRKWWGNGEHSEHI